MTDVHDNASSVNRYQASCDDMDAAQARKAAADLDLETAILRNEKAKEGADWRNRKCGECGYWISGPREIATGRQRLFCRRYESDDRADGENWFAHIDPACPDFIPREVGK